MLAALNDIFQVKLMLGAACVPKNLFSAGGLNSTDSEANRALMDDLGISAVRIFFIAALLYF